MRRLLPTALLTVLLMMPLAHADEMAKADDRVTFDLAAEDWVTTKTARVTVAVEAAVSGANAGTTRADMTKAVEAVSGGEWRLTGFTRSQDQSGLERWSASFEARLPEASLGGLNDNARKVSKAGMQLSVADIDFSPTLDEMETTRANLRTQIYKKVADQLTALNSALPGHGYRIAVIDFSGDGQVMPMMRTARALPMMASSAVSADAPAGNERSEKIKLMAHVVLAANPDVKR